mmetsp:Transcript_9953/g.24636  ORF Transcript_9953/g.24636 Transcript_9953/m.24636 type:complete len:249 (-) Transcript_9953:2519-3265(-)
MQLSHDLLQHPLLPHVTHAGNTIEESFRRHEPGALHVGTWVVEGGEDEKFHRFLGVQLLHRGQNLLDAGLGHRVHKSSFKLDAPTELQRHCVGLLYAWHHLAELLLQTDKVALVLGDMGLCTHLESLDGSRTLVHRAHFRRIRLPVELLAQRIIFSRELLLHRLELSVQLSFLLRDLFIDLERHRHTHGLVNLVLCQVPINNLLWFSCALFLGCSYGVDEPESLRIAQNDAVVVCKRDLRGALLPVDE